MRRPILAALVALVAPATWLLAPASMPVWAGGAVVTIVLLPVVLVIAGDR